MTKVDLNPTSARATAERSGPASDPRAGTVLLGLARGAIASRGSRPPRSPDDPDWLDDPGAAFVTLTERGRLRGCIGSIEPHRTLREDVLHNACAAAFHDPRFPPVAAQEVPRVRIEVSVLSPMSPVECCSRTELLARLHPGVDGVVLSWHGHRGVFLPQVWEQLPDPEDFVEHLLHKAGLPVSFWDLELCVARFTVSSWQEQEPAVPAPTLAGRG